MSESQSVVEQQKGAPFELDAFGLDADPMRVRRPRLIAEPTAAVEMDGGKLK